MTTLSPETERRLQSLVNRGIVTHVDHALALCRVQLDGLVTDWLPFAAARMGNIKIWSPPAVGEQVLLISETGELDTALVITSFDYSAQPQPSANPDTVELHAIDGAVFIYNHRTHALTVELPDNATTQITSPAIRLSANDVSVDCSSYSVNCADYAVSCSSYSVNGSSMTVTASLTINGTPYAAHTHTGVETGRGSTGGING